MLNNDQQDFLTGVTYAPSQKYLPSLDEEFSDKLHEPENRIKQIGAGGGGGGGGGGYFGGQRELGLQRDEISTQITLFRGGRGGGGVCTVVTKNF